MAKQSIAQLCARIKSNASKGDRAATAAEKAEATFVRLSVMAEADAERHYMACGRDLIKLRKQLARQTGNEKRVDFKRYVKAHCGMSDVKAYTCIRLAERKQSLAQHRASKRVHDTAFRQRNREARTASSRKNNVRPFSVANGRSEIQNMSAWLDSAITPKVKERIGGVVSRARSTNCTEHERDGMVSSIKTLQNELIEYVITLNAIRFTGTRRNGTVPALVSVR